MGTETAIYVGPWGGSGGNPFDDGSHNGVAQIIVRHGDTIDSIQILYDKDGNRVWSNRHGGQGGTRSEVSLEFPSEYLTGISGYFGPIRLPSGQPVIRSLTFTSNKATYGPFGEEAGTSFSLPMKGGKIVGFAGNSGSFLDNIGCYIRQS